MLLLSALFFCDLSMQQKVNSAQEQLPKLLPQEKGES